MEKNEFADLIKKLGDTQINALLVFLSGLQAGMNVKKDK